MNIWEPTGPKSLIWQRIGYVVADLEQADLWATTCHCICGQDNQFPDNGRIDFNLLEVIINTLQVNTVCITSEWLIARYGKKCTAWSYAAKKKKEFKAQLVCNSIFRYICVFWSLYHDQIYMHECPFVETIDETNLSKLYLGKSKKMFIYHANLFIIATYQM